MIPVTVIGGYLGAGKTTFLNRLLQLEHGLHLTVLVNDFGAVNVDAHLINHQQDEMITLTNGCACCTIGDDLTASLQRILDTSGVPDAVLLEASGVANLSRLSGVPANYPGFRFNQSLCLVDMSALGRLIRDRYVGRTVREQLESADRILPNRLDGGPGTEALPCPDSKVTSEEAIIANLARELNSGFAVPVVTNNHPKTISGNIVPGPICLERLKQLLADPPDGLQRLKGFVSTAGGTHLVQWTVSTFSVEPHYRDEPPGLVYIGTPVLEENALRDRLAGCQVVQSDPGVQCNPVRHC